MGTMVLRLDHAILLVVVAFFLGLMSSNWEIARLKVKIYRIIKDKDVPVYSGTVASEAMKVHITYLMTGRTEEQFLDDGDTLSFPDYPNI